MAVAAVAAAVDDVVRHSVLILQLHVVFAIHVNRRMFAL